MLIGTIGTTRAIPNHYLRTKPEYVYICVSRTAHKFHNNRYCQGLQHCTHQIRKVTKAQAIQMGYTACKYCYG